MPGYDGRRPGTAADDRMTDSASPVVYARTETRGGLWRRDGKRRAMQRRRYLAAAGGLAGGLAGCLDRLAPATDRSTPGSSRSAEVSGADGIPSDICTDPPRPGLIPAIVDPTFDRDWSGISTRVELESSTTVVGIARDGAARAYPLPVLARFEIVNDAFDVPVLVTFCPICASGLTAVRRVEGESTDFRNTGHTWTPPDGPGEGAIENGTVFGATRRGDDPETEPTNDLNLVMVDRTTESYWSQLLAQGICGDMTGESLSLVPSTVTTLGEWRHDHPETTVLLPPPHSETM